MYYAVPHHDLQRRRSRQIPDILHLIRLGYQFLPLKSPSWDMRRIIFRDLFRIAIAPLHPGVENDDVQRILDDITL